MPHVSLPPNKPGMVALSIYRPDVYSRLGSLADLILHEQHPDSTLTPGGRELIASYVSSLNNCAYCQTIHGAVAAAHLSNVKIVEDVIFEYESSEASPKMKALLKIAGMVQKSGRAVTTEAVESAKAKGATEMDIHDTVLIAAMFSMFNRYVDGLATEMPVDLDAFVKRGPVIAEKGYAGPPVPVIVAEKVAGP
jgi:uncharacterized peroxidase-related enzyme